MDIRHFPPSRLQMPKISRSDKTYSPLYKLQPVTFVIFLNPSDERRILIFLPLYPRPIQKMGRANFWQNSLRPISPYSIHIMLRAAASGIFTSAVNKFGASIYVGKGYFSPLTHPLNSNAWSLYSH